MECEQRAKEFVNHGYKDVVASGGMTTTERWEEGVWSYAYGAQRAMMDSGVPETQVFVTTASYVERQRRFESALAQNIENEMVIREFEIPEVKLIVPKRFTDERGFFSETWSDRWF